MAVETEDRKKIQDELANHQRKMRNLMQRLGLIDTLETRSLISHLALEISEVEFYSEKLKNGGSII